VFVPDAFDVAPDRGFALSRETWVERRGFDLVAEFKVNNAVCAFDRGNPFLDYAIFAHEALVRDRPERVFRFGTSTALLTSLHMASPAAAACTTSRCSRRRCCTSSPNIGDGPALRELARRHDAPMHCREPRMVARRCSAQRRRRDARAFRRRRRAPARDARLACSPKRALTRLPPRPPSRAARG
jgi:hypothetical protein